MLDKLYAAGDLVPNTKKMKIHESDFKFFISIFQILEETMTKNLE